MSREAEIGWAVRLQTLEYNNPGVSIVAKLSNGNEVSGTLACSPESESTKIGDWTVQTREIVAWKATQS